MRVIYSIGARFAGGGIGTTAYHAVRGLYRHGMLYRLVCGSYRPTEIPVDRIRAMGWLSRILRRLAVYGKGRRLNHVHNWLYDLWATRQVERCNVFHAWGGFCLRSLHRAKTIGSVTVVERASVHPLVQFRLLQEEHARWGLRFEQPAAALRRALEEISTADYVLIPSDFVRETFLAQGVPEEKLIQIPFGVDITRFRPTTQRREGRPFRVLFVGQMNIGKGVLYLLNAWKRLDWQDAELWLVGRVVPEARPLLTRYIDLPSVCFLGHVTHPVALYKQADVFALPTLHEGSALVTYEALACGLPVVTTPNAGSVVRDGVEGFLVPIRDVDALAARLEQLRADERLRREMGQAARERAEAFTWEIYGERLVDAMQRLRR